MNRFFLLLLTAFISVYSFPMRGFCSFLGNGEYAYSNIIERFVIKKNIVKGVNILTQDVFYKENNGSPEPRINTIFVIQDVFSLNGKSVEIPHGCSLVFDGGRIENGKVVFNDTYISFANNSDGFKNCSFSGDIQNRDVQMDNFGVSVESKDNAFIINNIIQSFSNASSHCFVFGNGTYHIKSPIDCYFGEAYNNQNEIKGSGKKTTIVQDSDNCETFILSGIVNIHDLCISYHTIQPSSYENSIALAYSHINRSIIENIIVYNSSTVLGRVDSKRTIAKPSHYAIVNCNVCNVWAEGVSRYFFDEVRDNNISLPGASGTLFNNIHINIAPHRVLANMSHNYSCRAVFRLGTSSQISGVSLLNIEGGSIETLLSLAVGCRICMGLVHLEGVSFFDNVIKTNNDYKNNGTFIKIDCMDFYRFNFMGESEYKRCLFQINKNCCVEVNSINFRNDGGFYNSYKKPLYICYAYNADTGINSRLTIGHIENNPGLNFLLYGDSSYYVDCCIDGVYNSRVMTTKEYKLKLKKHEKSLPVGFSFFAKDKGKEGVGAMLYYTGNNKVPWVYADGTSVENM